MLRLLPIAMVLLLASGCHTRTPSAVRSATWSVTLPGFVETALDVSSGVGVVVGVSTVAESGEREWLAYGLKQGSSPSELFSGAGLPGGVAVSPNGSEALVCCISRDRDQEVLDRYVTRRVRLEPDSASQAEEFRNVRTAALTGVPQPWSDDGDAWLGRRRERVEVHGKGPPTTLHALPSDEGAVLLAWATKSDGEAYLASSKGGVFRVSAQSARLVVRLPLAGELTRGGVAAVGEIVFARNGDAVLRANLSTGEVRSREIRDEHPRLQDLRMLSAASDNVLLLVEMGELSDAVSPEYSSAETSRLFALPFSTGQLIEVVEIPAPIFNYCVDGKTLWLSWTEASFESSIVATLDISHLM